MFCSDHCLSLARFVSSLGLVFVIISIVFVYSLLGMVEWVRK